MKKRVLSLLLAICAALSLSVTACAAQEGPEREPAAPAASTLSQELPFTDVPADAWYAGEVRYCYENGIFAGTSGTTFSPDMTLSRGMLVTILYRAAGSPALEDENLGYPFADVPGDAWYADGVYWARLEGVVSGCGDNTFGPNDPVTREQAATILWRQAGSPAASAGDFSDGDNAAEWAVTAAGWAQAMGLLTGWADDTFRPQAGLTRAEAAVLLARYLEHNAATAADTSSILVAYFSATGTTRTLAEYAADSLDAGLYEIVPAEPYTRADLDYTDSNSRATREQNDPDARPRISGPAAAVDQYDTVLLGYPIWHGQAPKIVATFLEAYDFTGKTIVPFCTSGGSGIGSSARSLHALAPGANWQEGTRFPGSTTKEEIEMWIDGLGLTADDGTAAPVFSFETHTVTLNSGYEMPIMGLGTYSLSDEACCNSVTALLEAGGRLIDTAYMYHNESAQVILRWNLQRGIVVIPGSSDPDHIRENLDLFGFELTDAEMAQIAALDRNEKHDWY